MKKTLQFLTVIVLLLLITSRLSAQTTSWKGTTSTVWKTVSNWTNGVPTSTLDVVIGDANFTGSYQPSSTAAIKARSLTIGGTVASTLTLTKGLTVSGNVTINSNGTISTSSGITLTGNWSNAGTYTGSSTSSVVTFNGTTQTLGGSAVTTFRKLKVNAGSTVTLNSNVTVSGSSSLLTVVGKINPNESPTYTVNTTALTLGAGGYIKVNASTFAGNYNVSGTTTINTNCTIEYSATTTNQTISNSYIYSTLIISGAGTTKSLSANLTALKSGNTGYGNIYITSGTFDLGSYTANRGTATTGGTFSISNGATLSIGSTNSFPINYATNTLSLTSIVSYYGTNQTIAAQAYGNLNLSSSSGAAVKTMPGAAFTIAGNLTSSMGSGTSVSYTAASNITISGNITIGASTIFNGSSYSHIIGGNWVNNGTFTGSTSTISMIGPGSSISGSGNQNFYNLSLTASNITASSSSITIAGNLATLSSGTFTYSPGSTLTMSGTGTTISGTGITLDNLSVSGTVTTTSSIAFTGNIAIDGSFIASTGIITMSGSSKTISGAGTIGFYGLIISGTVTTSVNFSLSSALDIIGSFSASAGTATFTGSSTLNGTANLYNVTLNGTSLLLSTNSVLGVANIFTITAGTLDVTTAIPNTVNYNGSGSQTITPTTYYQLSLSNGGTKTAGGAFIANGDLTINTGTTFNASSYTHTLYNDFIDSGSFTAATSTITFAGNFNDTLRGNTTFNNLTINKTSSTNTVTLTSNISVGTLNMTNGSVGTDSDTLTITGIRNGDGIILGNITHLHSFTTGTAYAFEGPNNTITFSSVSAVTSITVSVTLGSVTDFPYGDGINRQYNISVPTGTYTATLRLHYLEAGLNGNDETTIQLWRYNGTTWNASGKTANDTSADYVEQSGLTNITNRWTLSDDASVLQWNGSTSSSWADPSNWTVIQGTPGSIPTDNDIAQIGTGSITNQPTISSNVIVKSIQFGSVAAANLTIASPGELTVNGNISGSWSTNTTDTITVGTQNLTVYGDLSLSDGTNGHAINLNASTGTIAIGGSLTESGGANITFTGAASLYIGDDFNYSSGTFTAGSSTVYFNGTASQTIGDVTYNNVVSTKTTGISAITNNTTINGSLTISSSELDVNATTNILGDLIISPGATLKCATSTITISGNLNNSGTFIPGSGTITFNGTNDQSISLATFNNITINKSSGNTNFTGSINVYGNFSILSGNIDLENYTANRTSQGGTFFLAAGTSLTIGGSSNFPSKYSNYSLASTSTVIYNSTGTQSVNGVTYGNLTLTNGNSNAKTMAASATVNGDLTINSGAILNDSAYTITLYGNWINNGTFTPSTGAVLLSGTGKTLTGTTIFNKLTVYGSYSVINNSNTTYNTWLNVTSGAAYTIGAGTAILNGDLTNSGSLTSSGTAIFSGTIVQTIRLLNAISSNSTGVIYFNGSVTPVLNSTSSPTFANLVINNTGGINPSVPWTVLATFTVAPGAIFNGGVSTHTFGYSFTNYGTVTSSGTLLFNTSYPVTLALGSNFSSIGTVNFGGTGQLTITGNPISFQDVIISNTNSAGLSPVSNWTINDNLTINSNSIFNAGSYSYNVGNNIESDGTFNGGTSTFTMSSSSEGELAASPNTTFNNLIFTGTVFASSDYSVSGNFTNNGTYDAANTNGGLYMTGTGASTVGGTTTPNTIEELDIDKSAAATVTLAGNISSLVDLEIATGTLDAATYSITQDAGGGALLVDSSATLKIGGINTLPVFGTYLLDTSSTINYSGSTQTISNSVTYGNLTISANGNKTPAGALNLLGNFTLSNGTFVGGSYTHTIAGNWNMSSGTFTNTGTTITLDGTGSQSISSTGDFKNLTINKTFGSTTLSSNVTIDGTLTLASSNISTSSNNLIISSTGSLTRTSGYLIGNLQKNVATGSNVARTFEVGDVNGYAPVNVTFASVTVAGNLIAKNTSGDHPDIVNSGVNSSKSVNKYWTLTNSGITFTNYSATFNYLSSDLDAGANTSNFIVANKNAGLWSYPTVGTKTSTSTQATGLTIFGDFQLGENGNETWTGAINTSWKTAGNWNPASVPSTSEYVTIATGSSVTIDTAAVCNTLTCNSSGLILTINSSNSLTVNGRLLLTKGKVDINGQTLMLNGSFHGDTSNCLKGSATSNLIIGSTYQDTATNLFFDQTSSTFNNYLKNLTVNSSVTLGNNLKISGGATPGVLTVASGATLNTGGYITLASDASGAAQVAAIPVNGSGNATGFISGNVTVQRYIPARRAWCLLTAPVTSSNTIYNAWQNGGVYAAGAGTAITGPNPTVTNGLDASTQNTTSMKSFNVATQALVAISNTKTNISAGSNGSADNTGYFIFVRGDRNTNNFYVLNTNATTLSSTGHLQTGAQTFTASATAGGFTLIGNPYASPVNFGNVTLNNVINRFYVWDPTLNTVGGYVLLDDAANTGTYTSSVLGSSQGKDIQSGQAFFVQTMTAGNASVTINESSKSSVNNNLVFRPASVTEAINITLNLLNPDSSTVLADGALAQLNAVFSSSFNTLDALKLGNINENIGFMKQGEKLAIERRPLLNPYDTLSINLTNTTQRSYQLVITPNSWNQPEVAGFLSDNYLGTQTPVSLTANTVFNFNVDAHAASQSANRFQIIFRPSIVLPVTFTSVEAVQQLNNIDVTWGVKNQLNITQYEVERSIDGINFTKATTIVVEANNLSSSFNWTDTNTSTGNNYYRIVSIGNDGKKENSQVVHVKIGNDNSGITLFSNIVEDGIITLQLKNMPAGIYHLGLYDAIGQTLQTKTFNHNGGNATEIIHINKNIAKGLYFLKVTTPGSTVVNINIFNN